MARDYQVDVTFLQQDPTFEDSIIRRPGPPSCGAFATRAMLAVASIGLHLVSVAIYQYICLALS